MNSYNNNSVSDELLYVVDQHNRITGQASRREIHEKNMRHRAAHILIFNQHGELFLQKRSLKKDQFPGFWDSSAAGHVDAGESYDDCIMREVEEELGIILPTLPEKLFLLKAIPETGMEFCQVYKTIHEGPFYLNPDEIDEGRWFTDTEIRDWMTSGGKGFTSCVQIMINMIMKAGV